MTSLAVCQDGLVEELQPVGGGIRAQGFQEDPTESGHLRFEPSPPDRIPDLIKASGPGFMDFVNPEGVGRPVGSGDIPRPHASEREIKMGRRRLENPADDDQLP